MKQDLKRALRDAFEPPAPEQKDAFLKNMLCPEISNLDFMLSQAGYIRKYVWGISVLIFGIAIGGVWAREKEILWVISALLPFAAVSVVAEYNRSHTFLMSELEMASRFSLKSVVLARMGILGTVHLCLLIFLIPVCTWHHVVSILQTGVYLLVPYLLTTSLGLWAARILQGVESLYVCAGIASGVSGVHIFIRSVIPVLFEERYIPVWILLLAATAITTVREWKRTIKLTEELVWN